MDHLFSMYIIITKWSPIQETQNCQMNRIRIKTYLNSTGTKVGR